MADYYNEFDPKAAAWLRELIRAGLLPDGDVDERSIEDVRPNDLRGYRRCHFFAGIGGWAYALELAGWPDSLPVWTGSCPCQPFSAAGKGAGFEDERHLWPAWQHLVAQCEPAVVFGEQVASKAADEWIDLVQADLEGLGYAFGCVPFPAAGISAPHIRDRNYWMGYRVGARLEGHSGHGDNRDEPGRFDAQSGGSVAATGAVGGMADHDANRCREDAGAGLHDSEHHAQSCSGDGGVANPASAGSFPSALAGVHRGESGARTRHGESQRPGDAGEWPSPVNGFWRNADWLLCRDGKWRPVEPGTFPLADGIPARVVRLRGYGNAIVPQQAAVFIQAAAEVIGVQCGDLLALEAAA